MNPFLLLGLLAVVAGLAIEQYQKQKEKSEKPVEEPVKESVQEEKPAATVETKSNGQTTDSVDSDEHSGGDNSGDIHSPEDTADPERPSIGLDS